MRFLQMLEKKVQKQLLEEAVTQRMFRARNQHAEVSRVDYHGITVDDAMRMLYNKLKYLKSNPDPGESATLRLHE